MKKTKAIIFDLNGILVQSPLLSDRFSEDFNVDESEFLKALKEITDIVRRPGANSFYSYWKKHFDKWNVSFSEKEFYNYCFSVEKEVPEIFEKIKTQLETLKDVVVCS